LSHFYFEKNINNITNRINNGNLQKFVIHGSFIAILIIATTSMATADESILTQTFTNSEINEIAPHGHIEDFSWIKKVSTDGVIEISGIGFSVVNDDEITHSFEICSIIQGPLERFTPALDSPLACITTEKIESGAKTTSQTINFSQGVKVSDLVDISIAIQEL